MITTFFSMETDKNQNPHFIMILIDNKSHALSISLEHTSAPEKNAVQQEQSVAQKNCFKQTLTVVCKK